MESGRNPKHLLLGVAYDDLAPIPGASRAICFTDQHNLRSDTWEIIHVPPCWETVDARVRAARRYKLLPHTLFPEAGIWIWLDAALKLHADPVTLIDFLGDHDIATFRYPDIHGPRDCIYQEAAACIQRQKDDPDVIRTHMARYQAEGFPPHCGLVETTAIVRRNTSCCRRFNEMWWSELENSSRRDQLSFNYVAWKLCVQYSHLPGARVVNPFSVWTKHKENIYV